MKISLPGLNPAFSIPVIISSRASSFEESSGANPPSSPTDVKCPFDLRTDFKLW
jgi:hypothetical protein